MTAVLGSTNPEKDITKSKGIGGLCVQIFTWSQEEEESNPSYEGARCATGINTTKLCSHEQKRVEEAISDTALGALGIPKHEQGGVTGSIMLAKMEDSTDDAFEGTDKGIAGSAQEDNVTGDAIFLFNKFKTSRRS